MVIMVPSTLLVIATIVQLAMSNTTTSNDSMPISITQTNTDRIYYPGELVFQDEFETFDLETWTHENTLGGRNTEFQMYINSRENSYVKDGKLFIKPTVTSETHGDNFIFAGQLTIEGGEHEGCTSPLNFGCFRSGNYPHIINPVTSAKIYTVDSFNFRYGRVVVRAKMPAGDWLWPAMRLQPRFNTYGPWPRSGMMNVFESRGNRNYVLISDRNVNVGTELVQAGLIFGPSLKHFKQWKTEKFSMRGEGFDRDFHLYEVEWTDEHIKFSIDGVVTESVQPPDEGGFWSWGYLDHSYFNPWTNAGNRRMAPFDQKFHLELSVAVGGTSGYFPDEWFENVNVRKPWHNGETIAADLHFYESLDDWYSTWEGEDSALQIDYIRVYAV